MCMFAAVGWNILNTARAISSFVCYIDLQRPGYRVSNLSQETMTEWILRSSADITSDSFISLYTICLFKWMRFELYTYNIHK